MFMCTGVDLCVYACACVYACMRACVRACVCVCVLRIVSVGKILCFTNTLSFFCEHNNS